MQDKTKLLPLELWRVILSQLSIVDLCHCCQVSKIWQELVRSLDNTRWKELYLFQNPWRHPNWPNKPKSEPKSWQTAYKERFLASKQWLKSGFDHSKCGLGLWHFIKKRNPKCLFVGQNRTYLRLKEAVAASSAYDTIYIEDASREEPNVVICIKHPLEIIGLSNDRKIRLSAFEFQCSTARISNICLRPVHRQPMAPNPLPTVLKVTTGTLFLDNSNIEHGHILATSPGEIYMSYCFFNNASVQIRTSGFSKIEHCEFQHGDHTAVLIEGMQLISKYMPFGFHVNDWMAYRRNVERPNVTPEDLYSSVVHRNLQRTIMKVSEDEVIDYHSLVKDVKEKTSLSESHHDIVPEEMSMPLAQRTSFPINAAALAILRNSTGCIIRECRFYSKRTAISLRRQASAWIEGCDILNFSHGVCCRGSSKVVLLANIMRDCSRSAVFFRDRSGGLVAGNSIYLSGEAGVDVRSASEPIIQHNQIFKSRRCGVIVIDGGRGTLFDNDIISNVDAGVCILYRANPVIRCNRIWKGHAVGIAVAEEGFGYIYCNDICGTRWAAVDIRSSGHPVVMNNAIHRNLGDSITIQQGASGLIFQNVIQKSRACGVWILSASRPLIFGNYISECGGHGIAFVNTADERRRNQKLSSHFVQHDQDQDQAPALLIYDDEDSSRSIFEDTSPFSFEFLLPQLEKNCAIVDYNKIAFNHGCGLNFTGSGDVIIRGNSFTNNRGNGIAIEQPVEVSIHSNLVISNCGVGIALGVSSLACVRDNCVHGNHRDGIVAQGRGRIRENDVIGNLDCGIVILGPGDPFIVKNRVVSGQCSAIDARSDARGCVSENEVYSKAQKQISQELTCTTIIENNDLVECMPDDINRRPMQSGNAIPRQDISNIIAKLTMPQTQKTTNDSRTMSRFCVIL